MKKHLKLYLLNSSKKHLVQTNLISARKQKNWPKLIAFKISNKVNKYFG